MAEEILVSTSNYHAELKEMVQKGIIPCDLGLVLINIIRSLKKGGEMPEAREKDIQSFVKHGIGSITIIDAEKKHDYDISFYVPDNPENSRRFFFLLPKFPFGKLVRIEGLMSQKAMP